MLSYQSQLASVESIAQIIKLQLNGKWIEAQLGSSLAAVIYAAGQFTFRKSESGQPRGALCGMGICFECRVTVDGNSNCRSCQLPVRDGMVVVETA